MLLGARARSPGHIRALARDSYLLVCTTCSLDKHTALYLTQNTHRCVLLQQIKEVAQLPRRTFTDARRSFMPQRAGPGGPRCERRAAH
jgi:hypothetical protein